MARFFLDTNVVIYSMDDAHASKQRRAFSLVDDASNGRGIISYQIVQECLHLMLKKFQHRATIPDANLYLTRVLMPMCKIYPSGELYAEAIAIGAETGWTFYDSLVVSSAMFGECEILYTEDLQHGRTIRGVKIQNPFV